MERRSSRKTIKRAILFGLAISALTLSVGVGGSSDQAIAAWLCPKEGDYVSGFNRVCLYHCPTGQVAVTVSATELCPISIER